MKTLILEEIPFQPSTELDVRSPALREVMTRLQLLSERRVHVVEPVREHYETSSTSPRSGIQWDVLRR